MLTEIEKGDIFAVDCAALVNPVNCMGVSGKGLALAFSRRYPDNQIAYEERCKNKGLHIGEIFPFKVNDGPYIVNFPTKMNWVTASNYEWIADGLEALYDWCQGENIADIAMPALGCGEGRLEYKVVRQMICGVFSIAMYTNKMHVYLFEPQEEA